MMRRTAGSGLWRTRGNHLDRQRVDAAFDLGGERFHDAVELGEAEQRLHDTQIRAALQQVAREGMRASNIARRRDIFIAPS